ncbi:MAG: AtpZ/AtpI family protein [Alphaproteobacteria bacterium]
MTEDREKPPNLSDLDARLTAAMERHRTSGPSGKPSGFGKGGGFGAAIRVAVDLVAGIAVGTGIGWLLDRWLGTSPWLLVVFFVLGSGAGIMNVMRTARQLEDAAQEEREESRDR